MLPEQPIKPLVRATPAVATLKADAMPDEQRIAFAELQTTAGTGLIESRCRQSRVLPHTARPSEDLLQPDAGRGRRPCVGSVVAWQALCRR